MAKPEHISNETILEALAAHPGVTAPELAALVGLGQSTAAKRLAELHVAGQVTRDSGGAVGARRVAQQWSVVPAAGDAVANTTGTPRTSAQKSKAASGGQGPASEGDSTRLGRGALGALVLDYLRAQPDESFGPSAISKALGRSAGAVSNSLATMADRGEVAQVGDKPRRYQVASSK